MKCEDFDISIRYDSRRISLKVKQVYLSDQLERYDVSGRNRSITIQSNRPLLRTKGLKYRRPNWKLISGQITHASLLEQIINGVEAYLKMKEKENRLPPWGS